MNKLTSFLLLLILSLSCHAQEKELKIEKGRFYIDNKKATLNDFVLVMEPNQLAFEEALKAKSKFATGNFFGFIGGFMVGWPLGTAVAGGDPNWKIAWAGLGALAISIPILSSANKKMNNAISIYKNDKQLQSHLLLNVSPTSLKITYTL